MNKKGLVFCFVALGIILFFPSFVLGEVMINEVMYDSNGTDTNHEWIEIYNNGSETINFTNWKFYEADTKHGLTLTNGSQLLGPDEYAIISDDSLTFLSDYPLFTGNLFDSAFSLSNSGESITLWNGSDYIGNLTYNTSIGANGNGKSLQFYNNSWQACTPTPGMQNNCTIQIQNFTCEYSAPVCSESWGTCMSNVQNKTCINSTTTPNCSSLTYCITQSCTISTPSIYIDLKWDDEYIVNSDEFEITVKAYNLEDSDYDVLIEIQDNDGKTISERYGKYGTNNSKVWKSSKFYALEFVSGEGNDFEDMRLRINSDYDDFSGDSTIIAKIRENGKTSVIDEFEEDIEIIEGKENNTNNTNKSVTLTNNTSKSIDENNIIKLGSKINKKIGETEDIKTEKSTIYKSKNEYIKEYAIYGFAVFCVFLIVLLLVDKR